MSSSLDSGPEHSMFGGSSYFELRTTTHGGRSLFATSDIAPGTWIHSCEAPFSHVIYKDYRKEVCAYCFAYSASDNAPSTVGPSRTWSIKWSRPDAATAWFCSEGCKDSWEHDDASSLLMQADALLTKGQAATRKRFKSLEEQVRVRSILPTFESEDGPESITQEEIDATWERAEALVASRTQLAYLCSTLHIEDMELEIARSLAAAIVRRYWDARLDGVPSDDAALSTTCNRSESWLQLLRLQTNELSNIRTRPYMLTAYLRIFVFLSNALPRYLRGYISIVREVFARDSGNAFGMWDGDRGDEMIGWGIWVSASYFNHSCMPNVRKKRVGRALHFETTRRVETGEELCISYIETDSPRDQRRRELEESWFFTCRCVRCESGTDL